MLTIAFCYDLKSEYLSQGFSEEECLELDAEDTVDAITHALEELGHKVVKIGNLKSLIKHLASENKPQWDLVFNISEVNKQSSKKNVNIVRECLEWEGRLK